MISEEQAKKMFTEYFEWLVQISRIEEQVDPAGWLIDWEYVNWPDDTPLPPPGCPTIFISKLDGQMYWLTWHQTEKDHLQTIQKQEMIKRTAHKTTSNFIQRIKRRFHFLH